MKKDIFAEWKDELVMKLRKEIGNKWSKIAERLSGRTSASIKNC
jgi:hypothetical protein